MVVCGTGHRPDKLGGYTDEVLERAIAVAEESIVGYDTVISGMALGWDTALAIAAVNKGIPFIAAVPFLGYEARWPADSQNIFNNLLDLASKVVIVCDGDYGVWKLQKRNEWMVDNSDVVLALWDGSSGGTSNCIRYATKMQKPIKNVWSRFTGVS